MCGRFTVKTTWAELVALYRLTMDAPPHNLRPRYNVCPTDPVDVVTERDGKRDLVPMRWGLVPWWWSKPLKELRMATFNARAETVETKPVFRDAFKRSRCLIPTSGYYEWQSTSLIGLCPFRVELAVDKAAPTIDLPLWSKFFERSKYSTALVLTPLWLNPITCWATSRRISE
jgi:putative SOS response-associated peptidase YedK